jgi:hypothetical protein
LQLVVCLRSRNFSADAFSSRVFAATVTRLKPRSLYILKVCCKSANSTTREPHQMARKLCHATQNLLDQWFVPGSPRLLRITLEKDAELLGWVRAAFEAAHASIISSTICTNSD